jgi:ATP-dependent Lon protease
MKTLYFVTLNEMAVDRMSSSKIRGQWQQSAVADLRRKVVDAKMPAGVEKIAEQELEMLTKISPASAEYSIGLTYIDYLVTLLGTKGRKTTSTLRAPNGC